MSYKDKYTYGSYASPCNSEKNSRKANPIEPEHGGDLSQSFKEKKLLTAKINMVLYHMSQVLQYK